MGFPWDEGQYHCNHRAPISVQGVFFLTVKCVPGFCLFSSLFRPFRGWKLDFCSKLMSCLYRLIFSFSLPLFIFSPSHSCSFESAFQLVRIVALLPDIQSYSPAPLSSISFIPLLSGVRPGRLRVLWESRVPHQPPLEPQLASGAKDREGA